MPDVLFAGETFRTVDAVPMMALLRLARIARAGVDANTMEGLSALDDMLQQVVVADDWSRFEAVALRTRAGADDLMRFLADCRVAIEAGMKTDEPEPEKAEQSVPVAAMWG